jgi:predicted RNA-binding protein with RPS1 domain
MSDPSESATPAPAPPPEAVSTEASGPPQVPQSQAGAPEPNAPQGDDEPRRKGPSVRIGTQRFGVKAPPAIAKPVLPAPPPELLAKAQAASAAMSDYEPAESDAASGASAADKGTGPAADGGTAPPAERKAKPPRGRKPRSLVPIAEPPAPRKYPPPNLRSQLSPDLQMEYIEALGDQSLDEIIAGQSDEAPAELEPESRHHGTVISIHRDDVFLEIGGHLQGVVSLNIFDTPPEPGAVVEVMVSRFDPAEGLYELTLPGAAVEVGDWSEVAEGMVVEARVTGHNKGGLECEVNRLRGFIPASQISMYRVEDLAQFVDQKFPCVVTEANAEKRNLVLSRRAILERERAEAKEKIMASLEVGQTREGTVRSLQSFGAFVDLGGVDGLIHISQLSWDRVKHADEVLQVGQKVKVNVLKIDPQTGKIGLGFRDLSENPWETAARDYPARTPVKGRVTRITDFGAFVRLGPGVEGLVHISELSHKRVFRVTDVLSEGQDVEVMVLSVDPEQQRISLSLKALEAKPAAAQKEAAADEPPESETPRPAAKKRKTPLRGGIGGPSTGEQFGLKW